LKNGSQDDSILIVHDYLERHRLHCAKQWSMFFSACLSPLAQVGVDQKMQEILTAVTYLVAWLACEKVFHIESGLTKLIISLGAAVGVYVLIAVKESRNKTRKGRDD